MNIYINLIVLFNSYDGLWTITEIVRRTDKLPTVRQLIPSSNQTTSENPPAQAQFHPRQRHHHHHHHRHHHHHSKFM